MLSSKLCAKAKPCLQHRSVCSARPSRRVAAIRADFIPKSDPAKPAPASAPVKEEATLSNNIKPVPTVEAVNAAAASSASPSPAKQPDTLADLQHLRELIDNAVEAQRVYADFTQEQVDAIFKAAASAASAARIDLAVMAVTESGMGLMEDKVSNGKLLHACMRCMAETAVNYRQHLTWAAPVPSVKHVAANSASRHNLCYYV